MGILSLSTKAKDLSPPGLSHVLHVGVLNIILEFSFRWGAWEPISPAIHMTFHGIIFTIYFVMDGGSCGMTCFTIN